MPLPWLHLTDHLHTIFLRGIYRPIKDHVYIINKREKDHDDHDDNK
jgi:hypothetical protein